MIYVCADDYGLSEASSGHIDELVREGALNKISIFPNFMPLKNYDGVKGNGAVPSLHINLVEGQKMEAGPLPLLTDEEGKFKHTFTGLYKLSLFKGRELEDEVYREIRAQLRWFKRLLGEDAPMLIDSHQHIHMIPAVFKALGRAVEAEKVQVRYLRMPAEPVRPFLAVPSLYFTYSPVNLIKQWLLKFLGFLNRKNYKKYNLPPTLFFGVLFSGRMDKDRVEKVLPHYIKLAKRKGCDLEVLFHPGYMQKGEADPDLPFADFHFGQGRKTEYEAVRRLQIKRKEAQENAVY